MSQTSDILDTLRKTGIPMGSEQLAEQLPHITRQNISSLCSQLRKRQILVGAVEDGKLSFSIAPGAAPFKLSEINLDQEAGVELPAADDTADEQDSTPIDEKPPTQSFSPAGMDIRVAAEIAAPECSQEAPKSEQQDNADVLTAARHEAARARAARYDGRLCRELAAAIVARWPGQIPFDVQRLVNSAVALPL